MKIAVIDTGTNSTRLLVADVSHGKISEIHRQTRVTRLGEGVDHKDMLAAEARKRVVECVQGYAALIDSFGVARTMVLATSSVRDARNGKQFLRSLAEGMGFEWKIISGEEEAVLSYAGATAEPGLEGAINLFDIGGGSTEIVSGKDGEAVYAVSLSIGCVRLTERLMNSDPVVPNEMRSAGSFIDEALELEVDPGRLEEHARTIAVAGTVTALAAIDLGLDSYNPARIHGHTMSLSRVRDLLKELSAMSTMQRMSLATMESGRADVIVAGTLILERLMVHTGASELTVSELDILDGAALALAAGKL